MATSHLRLLRDLRKISDIPAKSLLEFGHYAYMWAEVESKKIIASHTVFHMLEIEPFSEFLTTDKWKKYVHPKDLFKLIQAEETLLTLAQPVSVEYRIITKNKRQIFINHQMQLSPAYENRQKILSIIDDVTEQKRADFILESMSECFFELDRDLAFRRINSKGEAFFQVEQALVMDRPFVDVLPKAKGTELYKLISKAASEKTSYAQDIVWPLNNHSLYVSVTPYTDGIIVIFYDTTDITARKKNEEEILNLKEEIARKATDKYQKLYNAINEGFCLLEAIYDKSGKIFDMCFLDVNPAFEKQTGMKVEPGKTFRDYYPNPGTEQFERYAEVVNTGIPIRFTDYSMLAKKWFEYHAVRVGNPDDHQVALLFVDVTERKKTEETIQSNLRDTQLLWNLSERIIPEGNIDIVYNEILDAAMTLTNANGATVQLYDENTKTLILTATKGFEKNMKDHFLYVDANSSTSCGLALANNQRSFVDFDDPACEDPDGSLKMHVEAGYLSAQSTPLMSRSGKPIGMISTHWSQHHYRPTEHQLQFLDLLARQAADLIEQKKIKQALHESEERKAFLLKLTDALRPLNDAAEIQEKAAHILGEHLKVSRAFYFEAEKENNKYTHIVVKDYFSVADLPSFVGRYPQAAYGEFIFDKLPKGEILTVADINAFINLSDEERTAYHAIKTQAFVAVPLIKNGEYVGGFAALQSSPRAWTQGEITLIEETAQRTWAAVERAKAEEALRKNEATLERKVNERTSELNKSKQLLQSVFDAVQSSITVLKIVYNDKNEAEDFEILMVNDFAYKTHYSGQETIGKKYTEVFPIVEQNGVLDELKQVANKSKPIKFEQLFTTANTNNWFYFSVNKVSDLLVVITEDTTERRNIEREIKKSKDLLQSVWDTSLVQMSVLKAVRDENDDIIDFEIVLVNKELEKTTGRTDLAGKLFGEEHPGIKQAGLFDTLVRVVEIGNPAQMEYFYPYEGVNKWFISMFVKLDDGVVATTLDITARKNVEEEKFKNFTLLKQSEELAEAGSWEYNLNTKEFLWSQGMYRIFSIEKGTKVTPAIYLDYVIPEDSNLAGSLVDNIQHNYKSFETTLRIKPDGIIKTIKVKAVPLKNDNGEIEKMLGTDLDITAAKTAEEKIRQLNQSLFLKNRELLSLNSELKTFNSIAANDYKEAFRHLYTNLEFIITHDAKNLSDAGKANIRRAQTAIQKMKLLTDDIVTYSKIPALGNEISTVDLNEILQTVLNDLNEKLSEAGAKVANDPLPVVEGFPLLLSLLFHHLLDNAIKFKPENIGLHISIRYAKVQGLPFSHASNGDTSYHKISFVDNGIGFEQSQSEKIFTIFYRLQEKGRYRGSGVGLAICKKIMDLHHGFITAHSEPLKGATFNCFFPIDHH